MRVAGLFCFFTGLVLLFASCSNAGSSGSAGPSPTAQIGVSGFSPALGTVGTLVTIQGNNFDPDPFQITVRFGGEFGVAGTVQLSTANQILAVVPPGASTGKIAVTTPAGTFVSADTFRVLPTINGTNPPGNVGAQVDSVVEILGYGFDGDVAANNFVSFNGVPAEVLDATTTTLAVRVPQGAKTGSLLLATVEGTQTLPYIIRPSIVGYTPFPFGNPGDTVEILGFNFQDLPGSNQISFNGTPATITAASYSSLQAIVPPGFATGPVTITTLDGSGVGPFFYFPTAPDIGNFSPISGIAGTTVTIQGSGLPGTGFLPGLTSVKFNGVLANVTGATTASLQVVVPAGASTGNIEVSQGDFGSDVSSAIFTVLQPPSITNISPQLGAYGAPVTITGNHFDPFAAGNTVSFQGVVANVLQATPTQIVAELPNGASSGTISVQTQAGIATSAQNFQVVFSRYVVVANTVEKTLSVHEIDASLGQLRFQSFLALGADDSPSALEANVAGTVVYAADAAQNEVRVYSLGLNGRLAQTQEIAAGVQPVALRLHPSGNFLYAANKTGPCVAGTISAYSVGVGGALSAIGSGSLGAEPSSVAIHPHGQMLYAASSQPLPGGTPCAVLGGSVKTFFVNPVTGALSNGPRTGIDDGSVEGSQPSALFLHPTGNWLYVACKGSGTVRVYQTLSDGKLVFQQSVASGTEPVALVADPLGRFLYAVNRGSNDIAMFSMDSDGDLISLGGNVSAGTAPSGMSIDYSGKAYVASRDSAQMLVFGLGSTGVLNLLDISSSHRGPESVVRIDGAGPVRAIPQFAFVANTQNATVLPTSNRVKPFQIFANGSLNFNGDLLPAGVNPGSLAADPTGNFLYAANSGATGGAGLTEAITQYRVSPTGALTANGSVATSTAGMGKEPFSIVIDPSGSFAITLNQENATGIGTISFFSINWTPGNDLGKLVSISGSPLNLSGTSPLPAGAALHPNGRFYYVIYDDFGIKSLETYVLSLQSGVISLLPGAVQSVGPGDSALIVHPNGRFLYHLSDNNVRLRLIGSNGVPATAAGVFAAGGNPINLALTPNGRFLYTSNLTSGDVSAFSLNQQTGALTRIDADAATAGIQDFPSGVLPFALSVDRSGSFLYVTNSGVCPTGGCTTNQAESVSMYAIQADGSLVSLGNPLTTGTAPKAVTTISTYQ